MDTLAAGLAPYHVLVEPRGHMSHTHHLHRGPDRWSATVAGTSVRIAHLRDGTERTRDKNFDSEDAAAAFVRDGARAMRAVGYTDSPGDPDPVVEAAARGRGPAMTRLLAFWEDAVYGELDASILYKYAGPAFRDLARFPRARDAFVATLFLSPSARIDGEMEGLELAVHSGSPLLPDLLRRRLQGISQVNEDFAEADPSSDDLRHLLTVWDGEPPPLDAGPLQDQLRQFQEAMAAEPVRWRPSEDFMERLDALLASVDAGLIP
jgi:hypothetical protein